MILIIGLGNPGEKYKNTWHNVGFRVVDEFQKENNFPDFRLSKKFIAQISEGQFGNKKVIIVKPQTFMNESGKSVRLLINFYKITKSGLENLWIIHDDIDLFLDKIRISKNRGSAGHKGVESIIKEIGIKNFVRFRIGTKPMEKPADSSQERRARQNTKFLARFVLQKFNKEEEKIIKKVIKRTVKAIEIAIKSRIEKAMSEYNC